jgi:hypothetical protein
VRSIQIANEELGNQNTTDAHKPIIHTDHLTYKLDTIFSFVTLVRGWRGVDTEVVNSLRTPDVSAVAQMRLAL